MKSFQPFIAAKKIPLFKLLDSRLFFFIPVVFFIAAVALPTNATGTSTTDILVRNPSFEQPDGSGTLAGWRTLPGTGIFTESHNAAGLRNGLFNGEQHATFHQVGYIYQTLPTRWQPNTTYEV